MESKVSALLRPYLSLFILVPFQEEIDKSQLIQMVNEVNETQVAKEEVLSSSVYYYDRLRKELTV